MVAAVPLLPLLTPLIKDALIVGGASAVYFLQKPALAPEAPIKRPQPLPKGTGLDNGPVFDFNTINVNNTTYNITPPSVAPGVRVVYVDKGNRVQPKVNINIKAPPSIPKRKLPKAADGQSSTKTLRKKSISVASALENHSFGQLLHIPITAKKETITETVGGDLGEKVAAASLKNADHFALWLGQQNGVLTDADLSKLKALGGSVPYWDATALVMPQFLSGFDGEIGFIYGLEPLHEIASYCRDTSVNARQEVTGWVPKQLDIKQQTSKPSRIYKEPPNAKITNTGINGVAEALEFDWAMETTPEELLKGYGLWQFSKEGSQADFEEKLNKALETDTFDTLLNSVTESTDGNRVQIRSLPRLLTFLQSANFFRAGFHRLPQEYPEYLVKDKGNLTNGKDKEGKYKEPDPILLADALEIQDWQARQLDAFMGEWSTEIVVKSQDGKDENRIHLPNVAEAFGELFQLVFNINLLSEHNTQINIKQLAELLKLFNMGTITHDHAVAITKYLGYSGETKTEEVPLPYNPKAEHLLDFQKPSKTNIIRWNNVDKGIVKEELTFLQINAAKAASAVWRKYKPGEPLPGEKIKQKREEAREKADEQWTKWIATTNVPTGYEKTDAKPTPLIDNIPVPKDQDDA